MLMYKPQRLTWAMWIVILSDYIESNAKPWAIKMDPLINAIIRKNYTIKQELNVPIFLKKNEMSISETRIKCVFIPLFINFLFFNDEVNRFATKVEKKKEEVNNINLSKYAN